MSYFIPSTVQKRLLRYVLSRLQLLDTDALDLERLDIGWGRRSTIELRDVGLRIAKLSALLELPESLKLEHASIALLRITVPADIHTSSIIIEVNGIEAALKLVEDTRQAHRAKTRRPDAAPSGQSKTPRTSLKASPRHPLFGLESSSVYSDEEDKFPTPRGLAASFLAEEPAEEKEQLEAALNSKSTDLRQSVTSVGSSDDEPNTGLGVGVGLPGFLATFLRGISDRLQVKIKDVAIKFEVEIEVPTVAEFEPSGDKAPQITTIALHIEEVDICNVDGSLTTTNETTVKSGRSSGGTRSNTRSRAGKRRILLNSIYGLITSDDENSNQLSAMFGKDAAREFKSTSASSERSVIQPASQHYSSCRAEGSGEIASSVPQSRDMSELNISYSTGSAPTPSENINESTNGVPEAVMDINDLPPATSLDLAQTAGSVQDLTTSLQNHQRWPALIRANSERMHSPTRSVSADEMQSLSQEPGGSYSNHLHDSLISFREERSPSTSSSLLRSRRPSRSSSPPKSPSSPPRSPSPQFRSYDDLQFRPPELIDFTVLGTNTAESSPSDPQLDQESPPVPETLAESMMFSREQAESIYMSAIHEAPQLVDRPLRMPGSWDVSNYEDSMTSNSPVSPHTPPAASQNAGSLKAIDTITSTIGRRYDVRNEVASDGALNNRSTPIPVFESNEKDDSPSFRSTTTSQHRFFLARKFLELDKAEVWLPAYTDQDSSVHTNAPGAATQSITEPSVHNSLPGSFSLYAESKTFERGSGNDTRSRVLLASSDSECSRTTTPSRTAHDNLYEIVLHSIRARTDSSTSRLFLEIFKRIRSTSDIKSDQAPQPASNHSESGAPKDRSPRYAVQVQALTLRFLEVLEPEINSALGENLTHPQRHIDPCEGVLFVLNASDLDLNVMGDALSASKLEIGRFTFGFGDQDILSFNKQARLRTSVRDLKNTSNKDICISFGGRNNSSDMHIDTQPLIISLDLQRLDNTLGSLGGLSGLIELGNSIASESTVTASSPKANQRSRSVHFEAPSTYHEEQALTTKSRFNVRLSGAALSIKGKDCTIKYHSSAIKIVGREALVGVRIDDIRLTGPYRSSKDEAAVRIRLRDTSLKYLFIPEEPDLTRLISLLTPSKNKFEDDDDFLVDTLIRQRRKGSVLRTNISKLDIAIRDVDSLTILQNLAHEMSRLSTVTKYLPEENRPGLMTLGLVDNTTFSLQAFHQLGSISLDLRSTEFAHISFPSLVALSLGKLSLDRAEGQQIVTEVLPLNYPGQPPMLMARMIGDELEPTFKMKMWNVCFEYSIPLILAVLNLTKDASHRNVSNALTSSIGSSIDQCNMTKTIAVSELGSPQSLSESKPLLLNLELRDCSIGLTPRVLPSKALFMMTDARFSGALPDNEGLKIVFELRKASLLVIDDVQKLVPNTATTATGRTSQSPVSQHISDLCQLGFVSVSTISAAVVVVKSMYGSERALGTLDIEFKDELFVLETCADSTQTLIETMSGLIPPLPPSKGQKYRTEVAPMEDMMTSFTGDAFPVGPKPVRNEHGKGDELLDEDFAMDFDTLSDFSDLGSSSQRIAGDPPLDLSSGYLGDLMGGPIPAVGKKWDSANNRYIKVSTTELLSSPVQVRIRDMHIIWNLYDGYDWEKTRDTITKAVHDVEVKAEEKRFGRRIAFDEEEEKESVIGDYLFNSIYIGIPLNHDPQELTRQINRNIDDLVSETASHTSTANSRPSSSQRTPRGQSRKLMLERSKRHKVAFELRGVSADFFGFAPGAETQSSMDVRITDFEIFDHVPTSTWKKFATYMRDAGPREDGKPMVHLEICDVKPVPELEATELVIRATVLPVRLHVDQDALDFITRFFDFKDDTRPPLRPAAEQPYLQRVEVRAVPIRLDYKPKKVDYTGLRSGRTTEFMNFFILDGADMVLKHTIVYGTSGFAKLHKSLEDVWMPDIRRNQLPGVLSGLNGVRTLVNVATGVHDLVVIPVREYQKDGRIVRSISKGAVAFAKTTGGELTRFGAKLAIGAQAALQGAEDFFVKPNQLHGEVGWEAGDLDSEEKRAFSHYANQPTGILQGLKGAARSLERDLLVTKDVIIAISGEARESGSAEGAARAVVRHAPTLILRPMIGASKAISQTLMGATNTVDPQNRRRIEDKYKRY